MGSTTLVMGKEGKEQLSLLETRSPRCSANRQHHDSVSHRCDMVGMGLGSCHLGDVITQKQGGPTIWHPRPNGGGGQGFGVDVGNSLQENRWGDRKMPMPLQQSPISHMKSS